MINSPETTKDIVNLPETYTMKWLLTAGECDAGGGMPLTLIATRFIEVASLHANALGIGYAALLPLRLGWVLSRLTVEVDSLPPINSEYTMTTWIESINHRFSERCAELRCGDTLCCRIRATWAAIDMDTRQAGSLDAIHPERLPIAARECLARPQARLRKLEGPTVSDKYTFRYCDLDFNRHVNTVRYIEMLMNCFSLEFHDSHSLSRFEIAFMREGHYADTVAITRTESSEPSEIIVSLSDSVILTSRFFWS